MNSKKSDERVILRSAEDRQQATISLLRFGTVPSFEDFRRLCTNRIEAEKKASPHVFIEPEAPQPFEREGHFCLFYSGGEKGAGRMFSHYLTCAKTELITVYLEAIGVAPNNHLAAFEAFVRALRRK